MIGRTLYILRICPISWEYAQWHGHSDLSAGPHLVHFYDDDPDLVAAALGYFADGLRADEVVMVIATEEHRNAFSSAILERTDLALEPDAVVFLDAAETLSSFYKDGKLDHGAFDLAVGGLVRRAGAGGRAVRAYEEMVALLWDAGDVLAAIELESLWNELSARLGLTLFCAYPARAVSGSQHAETLTQLCHLHSSVLESSQTVDVSGFPCKEAQARFGAEPQAPRASRHFVIECLEASGFSCDEVIDNAALVVTEMATNSVCHAASAFSVRLQAWLQDNVVRVSVRDLSRDGLSASALSRGAESGRGIGIIAALARRWGVEITDEGKVVWAELSLSGG